MKTKSDIEQLADETLNSLDNIKQVEANSFLYAKIQAPLHGRVQQTAATVKILPALSVVILLFICLNAISFYYLSGKKSEQSTQQSLTSVQAFASEYHLSTNYYNY